LTNSGTAALGLSSIGINGSNATSYSQTHTCGSTLAVGASCTIAITFKPQAAGTLVASLRVADNAAGAANRCPQRQRYRHCHAHPRQPHIS
jgi:hypothetical protein